MGERDDAGDGDPGARPRRARAAPPALPARRRARARRLRAPAADRGRRRRPRRPPLPHVLLQPRPADPQRRPAGGHRAARPRGARQGAPRAPAVPPGRARGAAGRARLRHRRVVAVLAGRPRVHARLPPARGGVPRQPLHAHPPARLLRAPTPASPATSTSRRASTWRAWPACAPAARPSCASRSRRSPPSTCASSGRRGVSLEQQASLPRGSHTLLWTPPARGRYRVRIEARGLSGPRGVLARTVKVVLPKPGKRKPCQRPKARSSAVRPPSGKCSSTRRRGDSTSTSHSPARGHIER